MGAIIPVLAWLIASGCSQWRWWQKPSDADSRRLLTRTDQQSPMPFDPSRLHTTPDDIIAVGLSFDVDRFIVPTDRLDPERAATWKNVDELRAGAAPTALWQRNGLRIGIVPESGRSNIGDALSALDAKHEQLSRTMQSGHPLTLDLGPLPASTTVFLFAADGRLQGTTYDAGMLRRFQIDYEVKLDQQTIRVDLFATPELFRESDRPRYHSAGERIEFSTVYDGATFHALRAAVDVDPGDWLMIGSADSAENRFTLGAALMTEDTAGRAWETVLLVGPRLYRSGSAEKSP
ncbi:MAG: hypothetical protein HOP29_19435 [Phycisphaerales bacterium]|nr:hypothetical protein [Phycisphaerales bacterium]